MPENNTVFEIVIWFTNAAKRRRRADALLERLLGVRRRGRSAPDRGARRTGRDDVDANIA